jgi:hypothetical protein
VFTRFVGVIIGLVLIMAFLPVILKAVGWIVFIILAVILSILALGLLYRLLKPRSGNNIFFINRR